MDQALVRPSILRVQEVSRRVGLSRTTLWRLAKRGEFPQARKLTAKTIGWLESDVEEWIETRARIKSET